MSHRRPGTVLGQGLQEEYLAPLLEERGAAGDDAASDRREILNFHFQRRTGAEMMLEEMAHRDVESCRENPSVKRALRIVLERLDLEGNDARLAFVRHVHAEEAGQEEGPELQRGCNEILCSLSTVVSPNRLCYLTCLWRHRLD